ncbi:MAG: hypothetical protein HPY72_04335 [Anaerolineae bacterium]|nr:hypothetical protein [Anaerolineae bacterium]
MQTPEYFNYLSTFFTFLYLYLFVPISIILESYILVAYSVNMINEQGIADNHKFRRGVAVFLPFLLSLYAVLYSEIYAIASKVSWPFYALLLVGFAFGFLFMYWICRTDESDELFVTLSCFVSSLIFFSVLTVFIITRSFDVISFVFGFLFGVSVYIVGFGFKHIERLRFPFEGMKKGVAKLLRNIGKVNKGTTK